MRTRSLLRRASVIAAAASERGRHRVAGHLPNTNQIVEGGGGDGAQLNKKKKNEAGSLTHVFQKRTSLAIVFPTVARPRVPHSQHALRLQAVNESFLLPIYTGQQPQPILFPFV